MLLSFRFGNHRSFRDEQQLNLTPIYTDEDKSSPVVAVPVAGIFGANASGKSNSLKALIYMRNFALRSDRDVEPHQGLVRDPFRLDKTTVGGPSRYVVDLSIGDERYTYGFTLDSERVLEEWLFLYHRSEHYPIEGRRKRIFSRKNDNIEIGDSLNKSDLLRIAEITASTALFLSTVARFGRSDAPGTGADPLHDVYRWFRNIRGKTSSPRSPRWGGMPFPDAALEVGVVIDLLRAADIGITSVKVKRRPEQLDLFEGSDLLLDESLTVRRNRDRETTRRQDLLFGHQATEGDVFIEFTEESTGTQQLLDLAIDVTAVLRTGGVLVVDEIDASLHPMLTAKIIGLFQSSTTNPRGSQLIFTSHDAALLGNFDAKEVLRRDQIWFAEKTSEGASVLYPLSDFKPRKDGENRQRRYLNGNYGAVPDLSQDVFEQALRLRGELDAETIA